MESEGPYEHFCRDTGKYLCAACIYAEGRKSMEKDFKELLERICWDEVRGIE